VNKRPEIRIHSVQRDEVPEVEWVESGKAVLQVSLFFRVLSKIFFGQRWLSPSPPPEKLARTPMSAFTITACYKHGPVFTWHSIALFVDCQLYHVQ